MFKTICTWSTLYSVYVHLAEKTLENHQQIGQKSELVRSSNFELTLLISESDPDGQGLLCVGYGGNLHFVLPIYSNYWFRRFWEFFLL